MGGSWQINHFSARCALDDMLCSYYGWPKSPAGCIPARRHVIMTLGFIAITLLVSCVVDDVSVVFELVGSTVGSLVICIIPGLIIMPRDEGPQDMMDGDELLSEPSSRGRKIGAYLFSGALLTVGFGVALSTLYVFVKSKLG
ncbi:hypothetical protein CYMTET_36407 [Cymbomonas tetramitiformis]|uniref:Amino acid transporter transmembrane domain-containing protein n=1 Tax=Cymbomonas tetramitiformis TaxID=36881 RepID=A0AAE0F793_9CHLO|nr:hypothetical protein CYMTET_36407 [Cymbomonas tetramitiformis]